MVLGGFRSFHVLVTTEKRAAFHKLRRPFNISTAHDLARSLAS